ncbi:MAG: TetR/AcrR family transcriptional regulator [Bacteroidota bacterium]
MKKTKVKIIQSALKLFNEHGMVNVRLQHIADEAFVSIGNMAYHYKNKEAILIALYDDLVKNQKQLLAESRIVPLFENIDILIQKTYLLQEEYIFFYLDTLEVVRGYPSIGDEHKKHIQFQISQLKVILDFNVARGALKKVEPNELHILAKQIWMTMNLWRTQESIFSNNTPNAEDYIAAIWNLLIPYFSQMGKMEYAQLLERPYDFFFQE